MKYIDIHCHLDSKDYNSDRVEVLARMKNENLGAIAIGADLETSKKAVEIAEANENVWACIGIHPEYVSETSLNIREAETNSPGELSEFEKLIQNSKVVGVGECGLDYFFTQDEEIKKAQRILFKQHIELALKYNKPLMLHVRANKNSLDAYEEALEILNEYKGAGGPEAIRLRGNVHFFAGNIEIAKKFLDLGFTMSFTGVITFTHDYDEVIKYIPQNMLMAETDAPFVAPVPFRGKRNEPIYVIEVIKKLAEIRGEDFETLNSVLLANAKRIFGI